MYSGFQVGGKVKGTWARKSSSGVQGQSPGKESGGWSPQKLKLSLCIRAWIFDDGVANFFPGRGSFPALQFPSSLSFFYTFAPFLFSFFLAPTSPFFFLSFSFFFFPPLLFFKSETLKFQLEKLGECCGPSENQIWCIIASKYDICLATILIISLRINWPNLVQFKQYYRQSTAAPQI